VQALIPRPLRCTLFLSRVATAPATYILSLHDALPIFFTRRHRLTFDSLFRRRRSRPEMIATFLALLELVRQGVLMAQQEVSTGRSEEHTSELQSRENLVCRLLLEKKKTRRKDDTRTLR